MERVVYDRLSDLYRADGGWKVSIKIPNREVREVFILQIQEWFKERIASDAKPMRVLHQAFLNGDAEGVTAGLTAIMGKMISVLDTKARDAQKENFYHGLLLGLLRSEPMWLILSKPDAGIVIEVKYAPTFRGLDEACAKALEQIKARRYDDRLRGDGREDILAYGIAFNRKRCKAVCEKL